jgi:hypothetical protein
MDRRLFMNPALRTSVAAAAWARTGAFGARPPVLPQPRLPRPGTDVRGCRLLSLLTTPTASGLRCWNLIPLLTRSGQVGTGFGRFTIARGRMRRHGN